MKLLAVDSNSIINRAYYGIKPLTTTDGRFTHAILGFMNIIFKICDEIKPDRIIFAFDLKEKTFRHKMFDDYKAGRHAMPPELFEQFEPLKQLLSAMGYPIVTKEGYEADDILGTLSKMCSDNEDFCFIATGDRDSFQLVSKNVKVRLATTKAGASVATLIDVDYIKENFGITPQMLIDVKALMGDSSDNIPGVAGIGEKTALSLIKEFKSLGNVYENIDSPSIKKGVRAKLLKDKEMAYKSYDLAKICLNVPLDFAIPDITEPQMDKTKTLEILRDLELLSIIKKLGLQNEKMPQNENSEQSEISKAVVPIDCRMENIQKILDGEFVFIEPFFENEKLSSIVILNDFAVTVCPHDDLFLEVINKLNAVSQKIVTGDSKNWYKFLYENNIEPNLIGFDISLAAYLLMPTLKSYYQKDLALHYSISANCECEDENLKTASLLQPLFLKLKKEIKENNQHDLLYNMEQPLSKVLGFMEYHGFMLDTDGLNSYKDELDKDLDELSKRIFFLAETEFNLNSPKQLGEVLFEKLGLPAKKKTKTGYSTNAEVLEGLKNYHPIIEEILLYRTLSKLKSTYVDGLLDKVSPDKRLHSIFKQTETRTGRISSAEPNLQNIPIKTERGSMLRKFFKAPDGYVLVDADYSQIELRVLAHIADDKNMKEAFLNNVDIHTQTASQVFDMPPDFVTPSMRKAAKAVNFGIVYGIGAYSLSQDIGVTVKEADKYIKNYLATYSGVADYMNEIIVFATENGYVKTLFERRRPVPELSSKNKITQAFGKRIAMNTPIQGTAADIIKIAMIKVFNRLEKEKLKAKLILQVHDELIVESPVEEAEKVKEILSEEMEKAVSLSVNLKADANIGENWLAAK